jgi:hypothetical protein
MRAAATAVIFPAILPIIGKSGPSRNLAMRILSSRLVSQYTVLFGVTAVLAGTWIVALLKPYTPGSDLGYNLGLVGGLLMLATVLAYPMRKYVKALRRLGSMRPWFQVHMVMGVLGPVFILFHTTFVISSVNAFVAFASMMIVMLSGFVGRFAYRRIHNSLDGRKKTLEEFEAHMETSERGLASLVRALPEARLAIDAHRELALTRSGSWLARAWRFLTLDVNARRVANSLEGDIARLIREVGPAQGWDEATQAKRVRRGVDLVRGYLRAVNATAQFGAFERIFSLWHVMHVPLIYLLLLSAVYHVVAVHMY